MKGCIRMRLRKEMRRSWVLEAPLLGGQRVSYLDGLIDALNFNAASRFLATLV